MKSLLLGVFSALIFTGLVGCDNSVKNNVGGLPDIEINGRVNIGPVRYAKVQLVGVDQYGQPQKLDANNYYGDVYRTDENGAFQAKIQGAYAGALVAIVQADEYTVTVQEGVTETRKTQVRCALVDGCIDDDLNAVAYGDWIDVPVGFELWAAIADVQGENEALQLNVSLFTHLAAKLAYSDFVHDGTLACETGNADEIATKCPLQDRRDGAFTPQSIFEANSRIQKQFTNTTSQFVYSQPWSVFSQSTLNSESLLAQSEMIHGVLAANFLQQQKIRNKSFSETLSWYESSYLNAANQGQLYGDAQTHSPGQWDFKTLYTDALAYISGTKANVTDSAVADVLIQAETFFTSKLAASNNNSKSAIFGDEYSETLADKIIEAKGMVEEVHGWVLDLSKTGSGIDQYDLFFDADFAQDLTAMEVQWEAFEKKLSPQLQSFFVPMVEFAEYALLCARSNSSCDGANATADMLNHPNQSFDTSKLVYSSDAQALLLDKSDVFPKYYMEGSFTESESNSLSRTFVFTKDIVVETSDGRVEIQGLNDALASITFSFTSVLNAGEVPDVSRIQLTIPKLVVKSKTAGNFDALKFTAQSVVLDMLGVKDATDPSGPRHFNIATLDFPGQLQDGSAESANKMDVGINLVSEHPAEYYSPNLFPDLDVAIDAAEFKRYARFETAEDGVDLTNWQMAGFLTPPANVTSPGETLAAEVSYSQTSDYSTLDSSLRSVLQLDDVADFQYGALTYSGGADAFVVWKNTVASAESRARQCTFVAEQGWGCFPEQPVSQLGCDGVSLGQAEAEIGEVFTFLHDQNCIPEVRINGRGIYRINYPDSIFVDGESYDAILLSPYYLGLKSFSIRMLTRFYEDGVAQPAALLNILGAATDEKNISLALSLTHNYIGFSNNSSAGLYEIVPYGDRTLWFAMGQDSDAKNSALVYYIQKGNVTLTMSGFDQTLNHPVADGVHDPIGYLRYAGSIVGTLRKEGNVYVIRYGDGSWQVL